MNVSNVHPQTHKEITALPDRPSWIFVGLETTISIQREESLACKMDLVPYSQSPATFSPVLFLCSLSKEAQLPADNRLNGSQLLYNCVSQKPS